MINTKLTTKLKQVHRRLNGSTIEYNLTAYDKTLTEIKRHETQFQNKTDYQLKQISTQLFMRARNDDILDDLLAEAYALIREVAQRVLNQNPFDVQIIGGIAMHQGKLAEMQTGEGKTLTAVFPAYLNALLGKGVHVLTFNDYLARRDADWMGTVHQFLGLKVGFIQEGMSLAERKNAYSADITYLTAKEAGFDYLRDSLCYNKEDVVHRDFNFAIIDEADSILIDEARVPLIIAGASDEQIPDTYRTADIARRLVQDVDFEYDEYARSIHLTDSGLMRIETALTCDNLYAEENIDLLTRLNCAIHAEFLLHRDVDYIVRNGKIELVDEFTGRVADRRRWPDGLQAALEVKEKIAIQKQGNILNSITLQHFLQLYPKICGMTATAQSADEKLRNFYKLDIVVIPPNKPCIRKDHEDIIFNTKAGKKKAIIDEVVTVHQTRRPILVGTASVEESALLADALHNLSIKCEVLNAKRDEYEAQIIAQAGKLGAVTISTNMAGRGTDIRLGGSDESEKQKVMRLGGLYVIGTNKHESKRIDRQLRGRAGRQGDPGSSRFFISLEDDLFIKYRLKEILPANILKDTKNGEIDNPLIRREINRIQRIIEGQNLEIKKTLCEYSSLIENQRKSLFTKRVNIFSNHSAAQFFELAVPMQFRKFKSSMGNDKLNTICVKILTYSIDKYWSQYLAEIADIREGIHLLRLGGQEPFFEFQKIAAKIFNDLMEKLDDEAIQIFENIHEQEQKLNAPSATWTYLVNDNPFDNLVALIAPGNIGLAAVTALPGLHTPLLVLFTIIRRLKRQAQEKKEIRTKCDRKN